MKLEFIEVSSNEQDSNIKKASLFVGACLIILHPYLLSLVFNNNILLEYHLFGLVPRRSFVKQTGADVFD